ncbi:MAG: hypothetical protein JWP97_4316 [Labilithrix sp.]|nr:hypothetical protein [Labilithrix sp.]
MNVTLPRPMGASRAARLTLLCRSLDGGGAERVMIALAGAFAGLGHEVDLVILTGRDEAELGSLPGAVRVVWLEAPRPELAAFRLLGHLRRTSPSAILSTLVLPNALAVACAALLPRGRRPRVVVREANTLSAALRHRPLTSRLLAGVAARVAYPRADAIVAVSEGARDDLAAFLGLPRSRVRAIANPFPAAEVLARAAEPVDDPWLRAPREVPVVVAAGRLVPKKGFHVLLEAVALLRRTRDVRLLIMGEGPERADLERRVARLALGDHVRLVGHLANPFSVLARADLFVLSSLAEGMPNVLLEALACGCPVVATDCPSGPREILANGAHGALVPPDDAGALAVAMDRALAAPAVRSARATGPFDLALVARAYLEVLLPADGLDTGRRR